MNHDAERTSEVTRILEELHEGNADSAERLLKAVYPEFREMAARYLRRERPGHTLQPTALVHEAFLKLADQDRVDWNGRTHFFAVGAQAMRRILVDHARRGQAEKRGGGRIRVTFEDELIAENRREEDLLALDDALEKLAAVDSKQARIVELRFFGGLSVEEAAIAMNMSKRSVEREWTMIRSWLRRELSQ